MSSSSNCKTAQRAAVRSVRAAFAPASSASSALPCDACSCSRFLASGHHGGAHPVALGSRERLECDSTSNVLTFKSGRSAYFTRLLLPLTLPCSPNRMGTRPNAAAVTSTQNAFTVPCAAAGTMFLRIRSQVNGNGPFKGYNYFANINASCAAASCESLESRAGLGTDVHKRCSHLLALLQASPVTWRSCHNSLSQDGLAPAGSYPIAVLSIAANAAATVSPEQRSSCSAEPQNNAPRNFLYLLVTPCNSLSSRACHSLCSKRHYLEDTCSLSAP